MENDTKIKIDKKLLTEVEKFATKLIDLLGIKANFEVSEDKDNEAVLVNINSDDETGLLIGAKGENLIAIQSVLGMLVRQKMDGWVRIVVNVGDWREKQEEYLRGLAETAASRAKETGEPQMLYNLNPSQRRTVHMFLSTDTDVETESSGEGVERFLIVKPK